MSNERVGKDFVRAGERIFCIYLCENIITKKCYIGRTYDFSKRKKQHLASKSKGYFHNCLRKYGKENFDWLILEEGLTYTEAIGREIFYIARYGTLCPSGMNLTLGGEGLGCGISDTTRRKMSEVQSRNSHWKGRHHTLESRSKMSVSQRGKILSPEHKEKLSKAAFLRRMSPETREKMSLAAKGKVRSAETREKMSVAKRGVKMKPFSPVARANMSVAKRGNQNAKGAVRSPEFRDAISKANKGKKHSSATLAKLRGNQNAKGHVHDLETRRRISLATRGKTKSAETREKMSVAKRGRTPSVVTKMKVSEGLKRYYRLKKESAVVESVPKESTPKSSVPQTQKQYKEVV